jgi:hypothetical protein
MKNNKIIFQSFDDELLKIAAGLGSVGTILSPAAANIGKRIATGSHLPNSGFINKMKTGISTMFHGVNPSINEKTGKSNLTPGWKKTKTISKGIIGGTALTAGIVGTGTVWGGLTMEPGMNSYMSGEGPSAQGPVYGV